MKYKRYKEIYIMKNILLKFIDFYQKNISLWLQSKNVNCKFYPTCSEYTIQAIEKLLSQKQKEYNELC